jgi:hypothetical protein
MKSGRTPTVQELKVFEFSALSFLDMSRLYTFTVAYVRLGRRGHLELS